MPDTPTFVPNTDAAVQPSAPTQPQSAPAPVVAADSAIPTAPVSTPCEYCASAATAPLAQFYETKLFRVLVSRTPATHGHVVIVPKNHDPHFYSFDLDQLEEFGYLIKKVSFIAMRQTNAPGFTLVMSDGTPEVQVADHLEIHIIPRQQADPQFQKITDVLQAAMQQLDDTAVQTQVSELQNLMQLPQA